MNETAIFFVDRGFGTVSDMGLADRLRRIREDKNLSRYEAAKLSGMAQSSYDRIEQGKIESPGMNVLLDLARGLGVSLDSLGGLVDHAEPPPTSPGADHDAPRPEHTVTVPLRAVSAGGPPVDSEDLGETYSILHHLYRPERFVIRLAGDSMFPTFHDGDLLLVERAGKVGENTPALVKIGIETTVKRVSRKKGGGYFLRADNPLYRPMEKDAGEAEVQGRIVCIVEGKRP